MTSTAPDLDTASAVLDHARGQRSIADRAEAEILHTAVRWATMHPAASLDVAAVLARFGDQAFAIAGPGAPLVSEFCVAEFASAMGLPTEVGKQQLGEALELCYRLPRVQARIDAGDLQAWRARRIARETICLSPEAATYVDGQIAKFAHRVRPSEVDRLVQDAISRYMPELAAERRTRAADGRHFTIEGNQVTFAGTSWVHGELDLADAIDLETAVTTGAASLKACGSDETLDVRRSMAVGELARRQLALDLADGDSDLSAPNEPDGTSVDRPRPRQVVLHVHLAADAITGTDRDGFHPARVEAGRQLVTTDQVRQWCANPDTQVTVRAVIDLDEHIHVAQYEVPDMLGRPGRGTRPDAAGATR